MNSTSLSFGAILKSARQRQGMPQRRLAELLRVTRNTVINWEADRFRPDVELIPEICGLLELSPNELFQYDDPGGGEPEARLLSRFRRLTPEGKRLLSRIAASLLEEEQETREDMLRKTARLFAQMPGTAAAGSGSFFAETKPVPVFLRENCRNERADAVVRVSGDSMEPVYHDGDLVYFRYAERARSGEDVVCSTADGMVIKRVSSDNTLYSVNPDLPFGTRTEDDHVTICGIVTGTASRSDYFTGEEEALLPELFPEELRAFAERYGTEAYDA